MKMKTLRRIHENPEYREFASFDAEYGMVTHQHPYPMGDEVTIELLKEHCDDDGEINWDDYEVVDIEYHESGVIGADIRNKLSPPKNLVSLLEVLFDNPESVDKDKIMRIIRKEMNQTKISVEYLSKLFE